MSETRPKKPWWKRWLVLVLGALIVATVSACSDTSQQAQAPTDKQQAQGQKQEQQQQQQQQKQEQAKTQEQKEQSQKQGAGQVDEKTTKQAIKAMYDSLLSTYQYHKKSYDEVAWARFMRTYNEQLDKLDQEIQKKDVNIRLKTAVGDLRMLALEMTAELQGRQADVEKFKKMIEENLK